MMFLAIQHATLLLPWRFCADLDAHDAIGAHNFNATEMDLAGLGFPKHW